MEEYEYDPRAGFHIVHDLYCEMTRLGYSLNELYEYSIKEILFILKYRREGLAYEIWRLGTMHRAALSKDFPLNSKQAIPEMYEKQEGVNIQELPEELRKSILENMQSDMNRRFSPM